jgi:hypothetical protein
MVVTTDDDLLVAAGHSVDAGRWLGLLDELMLRVGARFRRVEPRRRARAFVLGLLAGLPRKNCWTLAAQAGEASPDGMQHLLERAVWDADAVCDDVRDYVIEHLGDPGAVLVVDETGDVKKGATAGVQRQYTGTAGKIENAQVAVYLTYAAPGGHVLIDRAVPAGVVGQRSGALPGRRDTRRCQVRHQTAARPGDDRPGRHRGRAVRVGGRRRGIRGQRAAPGMAGRPADLLRAGGVLRSPRARRSRACDPCR